MKTFPVILALAVLTFFRASAQVTVEVSTEQDAFLTSESLVVAVKITNLSGQQLHLGAETNWLKFSVESADGSIVNKTAEVPVLGEFDLESSQLAIKRVDIAPYFTMTKPGRYRITAQLTIKDWNRTIMSPAKVIDIVTGAKIWSQDFGLPSAGGLPEMRRYTLEQANFLRQQLRLYIQLSDVAESYVYKVAALGPMVSFGQPEERVDRLSQLHVLWQTGGQSFSYCIIAPNCEVLKRDIYDSFNGRPKLVVGDDGEVSIVGGTRRIPASEIQPTPPLPAATNAAPANK
ncbi:MAG TPA: hypothetical protein VGO57_17035 [Verrucomicrobiae bacterium]|jgi:hypothetical protein